MKIKSVYVFAWGYWVTTGSYTPDREIIPRVSKITAVKNHIFVEFEDKTFISIPETSCAVLWDGVKE